MYLQHALLLAMLLVYCYAIYNVHHHFTQSDDSISSILKDETCNECIFNTMTVMCMIAFIYENMRKDSISTVFISCLIIGIYGVILFDFTTTMHYYFSFIVFISILLFMLYHSFITKSLFLFVLFVFEIIVSILTLFHSEILYYEIYLLANFAIFYIYLHCDSTKLFSLGEELYINKYEQYNQ
jgi:signal transduction histidine kinase